MALSMFLRSPTCMSTVFSQQLARMATQSALSQHSLAKVLPITTTALKDLAASPINNAVRSLRTSTVQQQGSKHGTEHPHDHARLWVIEKTVSGLLVPLVPAALIMPNKIFDCALAVLIVAHSFWGFEAIAVDYVRASIFGPVIPKIAIGLVYAICIATLGGLFYLITHDIGIANTIRNVWAIKSQQNA